MAKGNLFLGMGRGKVGDVVFYRMNGWQMARVRNRNPKNPRSNEQLYQRAIIASTMKAYSAGKEIFDHSFQGYTVGEGCMRRFNSVNSRILREQLLTDINTPRSLNNQLGRFVAPRSTSCTPFIGMQVSEGTLTNTLIRRLSGDGITGFSFATSTVGTNINEWFRSLGVYAGDIFTFVYLIADLSDPIYNNPWNNQRLASQYNTQFGWLRLTVKDNIPDDAVMDTTKIGDAFLIETGGLPIKFNANLGLHSATEIPITFGVIEPAGVMACIRSRNDMDLRSTEFMEPIISRDFGIASAFLLDVWADEVQKIGESELILEGGDQGVPIGDDTSDTTNSTPLPGATDSSQVVTNSPVQESDTRRKGRTRA